MPEVEDFELIKNIKRGDPRSLELLFRRLYPRLYAYAQKFLHSFILYGSIATGWMNVNR
jgi:RNA polymerase sigma-70 factor (ECF subfamily)